MICCFCKKPLKSFTGSLFNCKGCNTVFYLKQKKIIEIRMSNENKILRVNYQTNTTTLTCGELVNKNVIKVPIIINITPDTFYDVVNKIEKMAILI